MAIISIIVPVYNVEQYLLRCIDSILSQTFIDFRLILVDDGSTDKSGEICELYKKKDNRITVIHKENGGLSSARNAGIDYIFDNGCSEWVSFIDSDDWVHPEYLSAMLNIANRTHTDIVTCSMIRVHEITPFQPLDNSVELYTPEKLWCNKKKGEAYTCARLYKTELFRDVAFPLNMIYEDSATIFKVLFSVDKIAVTDDCLYFYYINNESITGKKWNIKKLDAVTAHEEQLGFFKKNNFPKAWKTSFNIYLDCLAQCCGYLEKDKEHKKEYKAVLGKLRKQLFINKSNITLSVKQKEKIYLKAYPAIFSFIRTIKKKISYLKEYLN